MYVVLMSGYHIIVTQHIFSQVRHSQTALRYLLNLTRYFFEFTIIQGACTANPGTHFN